MQQVWEISIVVIEPTSMLQYPSHMDAFLYMTGPIFMKLGMNVMPLENTQSSYHIK
jgi:hypothetical protein